MHGPAARRARWVADGGLLKASSGTAASRGAVTCAHSKITRDAEVHFFPLLLARSSNKVQQRKKKAADCNFSAASLGWSFQSGSRRCLGRARLLQASSPPSSLPVCCHALQVHSAARCSSMCRSASTSRSSAYPPPTKQASGTPAEKQASSTMSSRRTRPGGGGWWWRCVCVGGGGHTQHATRIRQQTSQCRSKIQHEQGELSLPLERQQERDDGWTLECGCSELRASRQTDRDTYTYTLTRCQNPPSVPLSVRESLPSASCSCVSTPASYRHKWGLKSRSTPDSTCDM